MDQQQRDHHHGHGHGHDHDHEHGHRSGKLTALWHAIRPHSHNATDAVDTAAQASAAGLRAAWVGLAGMTATAVLQLGIVAISGSIALLADTVHNLGHAVTTIPLLIAFKLRRRAPTSRYPYGFRRAEDVCGLVIAAVIAASAVLIVVESVEALVEPRELANLGWVLAAGVVGALGNEAVAVYRIRVGRRIGSAALVSEGYHARADGLTSLVVVVGVIGVWLGFPRADAVVGLLVAAAVLWILVQTSRTIFRRLMDGVDDGTVEAIEHIAAGVEGVRGVGRARARWTGHRLEADVHIRVDATATVAEGHHLAEQVHHALLHGIRHLGYATVHVDPATDDPAVDLDAAHQLTAHHLASV